MNDYTALIENALDCCVTQTDLNIGIKYTGKVRDTYDCGDHLTIVTTDRQSAFDRVLAAVPFKGQVLNQCSAFWFEATKDIIPNHMLSTPAPNVMITKKCEVLPIEFVVRGYITGTTQTSLWTQYDSGVRDYCGHHFSDGLQKNQRLDHVILTPTTKEADHDRPISPVDIIAQGWLSEADWQYTAEKSLALFQRGTKIAAERGLILVDTKYEFGRDKDGNILLIDEVHTPDSSRYWFADSYQARFAASEEPENFDKEFLRRWYKDHCDPYKDKVLPAAPKALIIELSRRYIDIFERITGQHIKL